MADETEKKRPRGSFRGNIFSQDGNEQFYLEVPPDLYIMLKSGKIKDEEFEGVLEELIRKTSAGSKEEKATQSASGMQTGENPFHFEAFTVNYGEELHKHRETFENENIDDFLQKINERLEELKEKNGNYKSAVDGFANISISMGYQIFQSIKENAAEPENLKDDKLRNAMYAGLINSRNILNSYFNKISREFLRSEEFKPESHDMLPLLHGFSVLCTRLLKRERDAEIVRKEVVDVIDDKYETMYDGRQEYALDEFEQIRQDLRARVNMDIKHTIKDANKEFKTEGNTGIRMAPQEVKYDNLNFLDDALLHVIRYTFGIDAKKEEDDKWFDD